MHFIARYRTDMGQSSAQWIVAPPSAQTKRLDFELRSRHKETIRTKKKGKENKCLNNDRKHEIWENMKERSQQRVRRR